jgi:ElaB/YqjD/DUF883 family membrane-anchored ribosome-binding protein
MTPTVPPSAYPSSPSSGSSGADGLLDQPKDKAGQVVGQVQETAGQVTEQAKQAATSRLESQKDRAVDGLVTLSQALRQTGQQLHEQEQGAIGGYIDQAAERMERLTNHLRARDVPQLLNETEDLARRSPGLFVGAAMAIGFVGARFLMSSDRRARAQRAYSPGYAATGYVPASQSGTSGSDPTFGASAGFAAPVVPDALTSSYGAVGAPNSPVA